MTDNFPNWFSVTARANFEGFLSQYQGQTFRALQIGAFVGHATEWICQNIGAKALVDDVDTWKGSDEAAHNQMDWRAVYGAYKARVKPYRKQVTAYRETSDSFFLSLPEYMRGTYDFVYIDGDHTAEQVHSDAVNGWHVLKPGGIMAFDDYTWRSGKGPKYDPYPAIVWFLATHQDELEILEVNAQVWVRKR